MLVTDRLDAAEVFARNPHLVVVAITPWGLTGGDADRPASELVVQAESGALAIRGRPPAPPFQAGGQITDWVSGIYGATAAAAALRTSHGRLIDLAQIDVACITGTNFADLFDSLRGRPQPTGPARTIETPSIEPTLDGYVGFNTNTRQQFDDFCVLIERADLLEQPELAAVAARRQTLGRVEHDRARLDHETHHRRHRGAGRGIPDPERARVRRRDAARDRPRGRTWDLLTRSRQRVPRSSATVDDRRRAGTRTRPAPSIGMGPIARRRAGAPPRAIDRALPLDGIRVVDLTAWWAGPSAAGVLAALGADVIHVESVTRPDGMRMAGGMFFDQPSWWERSAFFLQANTNKRGVTLDLANAECRDLLLRLVDTADVVVENFTPRVLASFDLGWDVLHERNPNVVLVRMPAFGLTGPWRDRPGFAQTMEQLTGLAWLTSFPEDQPRIRAAGRATRTAACTRPSPPSPRSRIATALAPVVSSKRRCSRPRSRSAAELSIEWTAYGTRLQREGNRSPHAAPQNLYATAETEEWLTVSVTNDLEWHGLCAALGRDDWAGDAELASHRGRRRRHEGSSTARSRRGRPVAISMRRSQCCTARVCPQPGRGIRVACTTNQ